MSAKTPRHLLTRRQALGLMGVAGAAYSLRFDRTVPRTRLRRSGLVRTASAAGPTDAGTLSCVQTPDQTEGPYFVDERLERSDITVDPTDGSVKPGVPLRLRINVYRVDDGCAPEEGAYVDVWHADAQGSYSDVAQNGTAGRKFLRGYQVTDANGAVEFGTIYPGWYPGRTVHIHLKVRVLAGSETAYDFTSQLYFNDAVTTQVFALAPYNARGARDTTNATDGIFGDGGADLLLALTDDGSGGYVGTFDVGLTGLPATGETCADLAACRLAVGASLPDAAAAANARSRRVTRRLGRLGNKANRALDHAASSGSPQRQYRRARNALEKLLTKARAAAGRGTLGVSLAPLEAAVSALLGLLPAA